MYLIFTTYEEADTRNRKAIDDLGYPTGTTIKKWIEIETTDGRFALDVGNGEGLTDEEIAKCVDELP